MFITDITDLEDRFQIETYISVKNNWPQPLHKRKAHVSRSVHCVFLHVWFGQCKQWRAWGGLSFCHLQKSQSPHVQRCLDCVPLLWSMGVVVVSGIEQGLFVLRLDLSNTPTKFLVFLDAPTMSPAPNANATTLQYLRSPTLLPLQSVNTNITTTEDDDNEDLSNLDCLKKFWHWSFNLSWHFSPTFLRWLDTALTGKYYLMGEG